MKVTKVSIHRVTLPGKAVESAKKYFNLEKDKSTTDYESIIAKIDTDAGISGLGEVCTIGTSYMRGFPDGAATGVPLLAKTLIGENPFHVDRINRAWDESFRDDLYVKAPLDMALWDIIGRASGQPVCDLMGGRYPGQAPLYRSIWFPKSYEITPEEVVSGCLDARKEGFRHFQLKVGSSRGRTIEKEIEQVKAVAAIRKPGEEIIVDVNTKWTLTDAIKAANALRDLPVIIEQPCNTWEECIEFRRHCDLPVKLDELIETPQDIIRGYQAGAMDIISIKVARVGGLTRARRMRDLAIDLGIMVVPDDAWGSEIVSSSLLHFAASTDPKYLFCYTDLTDYVDYQTCEGYPRRTGPNIVASDEPGLGLTLIPERLGEPIAVIK